MGWRHAGHLLLGLFPCLLLVQEAPSKASPNVVDLLITSYSHALAFGAIVGNDLLAFATGAKAPF